ncbi:uncharacterized protein LOC127698867 [Mytilus californianus]|uniref:uncharacterized protein LOC127698867 n=1 Tax=Mytilus californianus TaxID=6549 RepID=UPI00224659EA|nr:uncharacterized protein LOC127698867 [Mytilus californianus]
MTEKTMASSFCKEVCTLCQDEAVSNQAVTWCTECEIFFCMDCDKHHKKSPSSKYHKIMSTEEYHKLPAFMQEISSQCQEHNKKFELYCSFHACPCCVQCVTKHQKCQDIKPLSDILTNVKSSASVQLLEKDLKDLKENFGEIVKFLKRRINTNNIQKTAAIKVIHTMRRSLDHYLNRLEQQILGDLESKHSKLKLNMNTLLKQLEHRKVKLHTLQEEFSKMTLYANELQMYIGLREIEKTTSQAAKYIEDVESAGLLNEKNLEIKISSSLQSILQDVKSFGDINITTSSSTVQIKAGRKDQAQRLVPTVLGIENIELSLMKSVTFAEEIGLVYINCCRLLPGGKILILDFNQSQLLLFSKDGIFMRIVVTFEGSPHNLCIVRNNTAAISLARIEQLALVDIEKNKIIKTIELSHDCRGVTSDSQILVVIGEKKCTIVNLKDMSHKILEGVGGNYISIFKEKIYCTGLIEQKVSCYQTTGEPLWTFMHNDIKSPTGLALDINGFVYVASFETNKIVVVSPDGKTSKTILSDANGIINPTGLDINRGTGMMVVACSMSGYLPKMLLFKT